MVATVFLLVVMVSGYACIVYGGNSQIILFLIGDAGFTARSIFAITAWAGGGRLCGLLAQRVLRPAV